LISEDFLDIDELTAEEEALFAGLLQAEGVELPALGGIPRRDDPAEYPLSFAQQRFWFLDQLAPGSAQYNIAMAVGLDGWLDAVALAAGLSEIARRHEVLRSTFRTVAGESVQEIAPAAPLPLPVVDLGALPEAERAAEAQRVAREERRRPFDLARGPLLRTVLIALAAEESIALATLHHIVSDAWSTGVLVRELGALYAAFSAGLPSPLPEPEIQYADFAFWQRRRLAGELLERELAYWRERLADPPPPALELPTDRPRSALRSARGAQVSFALPAETVRALRMLCRGREVTSFMFLLAAFVALLHRYTGQEDFAVGVPVAGRDQVQKEALIGLFVNTLALRASLAGEPRFGELLDRVREVALGAFAHQELPFDKLVEEIRPERDALGSPLFRVTFSMQNAPLGSLDLSGLAVRALPVEAETATFDLVLVLSEAGDRLSGSLTYSSELFHGATIERLARHFGALVRAAVESPEARLADLPLLGEAEIHQLLVEWNDTAEERALRPLVHELFSAHARRRPEAPAISSPLGRLTYGEVEARSNRLAHHLRDLGVGPEVPVAVCMERTLERVVGIVAALKAGGAFVSLDPAYPRERLAFLLEDAGAPVLLTEERFLPALPETSARILCLDGDWAEIAGEERSAPRSGAGPENLAYVVYTSGSTGQPKGVEVPHAGLLNLMLFHQRLYGVTGEDRGTQIQSPAFDASILELWSYLTAGASVHVPDEETRLTAERMVRWWSEQGITLAFLPTPLAEAVFEEEMPEGLPLRALIVGGDRLHRGPAPGAGFRLMNNYGPAEYSIMASVAAVPEQGPLAALPSIGRPVDNTRAYLLDRRGAPVPLGVPGELYVAGAGLARGYLRRPDLTAERFLPDPFAPLSGERGARMYRTGDLVRRLPDGQLDFLGRVDHQVKIRGMRIELGEIESVLGRHPDLREAAVALREERPGEHRLIAYVVAAGEPPASAELRQYLLAKLPEHMVPAAFVTLDALPLTPNGKVDRRALPAPRWSAEGEPVAPRTPAEEILAGIWQEVLGVEGLGIHESFFALGGHSLLATRVISRVRGAFDVELPLADLFERPTVARLAEVLAERLRSGSGVPRLPRLTRADRSRPLPLSFAQQRLWFLDQLQPLSAVYNIPAAVRLEGPLDVPALWAGLAEVVRRHESLRTTFDSVGGEPVQRIDPARSVRLPVLDLTGLPGAARQRESLRLALLDRQLPFDLGAGPLLRAGLICLAKDESLVLLSMHHIVSDGWSMSVLLRELLALYGAFSQGRPSPLPELTLQYADFAVWQRQWLAGEILAAELQYWRERLGERPPVLELPTDRPRPAVQTFAGADEPVWVRPDILAGLSTLARGQEATLFMTLLAAFEVLLQRYSGQDDFVLGSPIAGRHRIEIEGLIGFFVNMLVLRADLGGGAGLRAAELLGGVRQTALAAYAHQDLPFEKLVLELHPDRDLSRAPLFQVVFTLQDAGEGGLSLPGLVFRPLVLEGATAKFDLTLSMAVAGSGLAGAFEYNRDLFDRSTVRRMARHLTVLLEGLAGSPGSRVAELPLFSAAERQQMLEWNDLVKDCPQRPLVHELFSGHARRRPEATAISSPLGRLTYGEVETLSNRLAHHLRDMGVGPERLVAICMERTLERVVAIVAVLKAGAAYVSLDPTYPRERLSFLIEDAEAPVLLTEHRFLDVLPETSAVVLCLDGDWAAISGDESRPPESSAGPENLAYVVYTSGSTGRPKGVEIPHAGLMNLVRWHQDLYGVMAEDRGTQIASPAFDASIWELWPYLAAGASVHVPDEETRLSSPGMVRWWSEQGITLAYLMTPLAEGVLEEDIPAELPLRVRALIIGGDRLHRGPSPGVGFRLMNHYGPAEYTVTSTVVAVPEQGELAGIPSIGRPVDNTRIYVLDRRGQPAPAGVPGELYVAGLGLARGYMRRPDLTAEKFVPDPFAPLWGETGGRMYRTADLVRWLPDGNLDFLGRLDHQIKIRGLRIELGEIETVLGQHPALREVAVLVREDRPGARRLTAYVVAAEPSAPPAVEELRAFLLDKLPEYMVPAAFVALDALPLTPNGKVDRRALPAPQWDSEAELVAPRTPAEEKLAEIWKDVLGIEQIGVHDNFFDRGGHSLLATQVVSRVRSTFGVDLALRSLFETPTIAGLAESLGEKGAEPGGGDLDKIAQALEQLANLSEEEVLALLENEPHD